MDVGANLLGRDGELAAIGALLERVPAGPVGIVLEGDAGIGKSALWTAALDAAAAARWRVLSSRPVESETQLAFAALADLLDDVLDDTLEALPGPQRHALAVALLRAEAEGHPPDRRAVSMAALGVLRALSAEGPVVVAVDDLQWIDGPSARVLEFAVRRLDRHPVAFVVAARTGEGPPWLNDLERTMPPERILRIPVGPLDPQALARLIGERVGRLLRPTLLRVHRASGGNPFVAMEIARAVERGGDGPGGELPMPGRVRELVLERLGGLPEGTREPLMVVAALSNPTVGVVEAVAGTGAGAALLAAQGAGVLTIDGDTVRFAHPLLGSAVARDATPADRRALHGRLAAVVTSPEERARHLALASEGPDERVAAILEEAAASVHDRGAPDAAAELAELARTLTPAEDEAGRRRRAVRAARYLLEAGGTARARSLLEEAVAGAPPGTARAEALVRLAEVRYFEDDVRGAAELFRTALGESEGDPAMQAAVHQYLYWMLGLLGDLAAAAPHARASLELAERLGEPTLLAEALTAVADLECLSGGGVADDLLRRAMALEAQGHGLRVDESPAMAYAGQLVWAGDFDRARALLIELRARADERGDESSLPDLLYWLSRLECWAGNLELAGRYADEGYEVAVLSGQETSRAVLLYCRGLVDAHLGRVEEARAAAAEGVALAERTGAVMFEAQNLAVLGLLELSLGDAEAAHAVLGPLPDRVEATGVREPGAARFVPDEIEALIALGELDRAEELLARLQARGEAVGRAWALATAARCRALLLAARGGGAEAAGEAARSVELSGGLGQPFELARSLLVAGAIHRRERRWGESRAALGRADELFRGLGAARWSERAREQLERVGGRPPAADGLTPTEERVAALVAQGRTNREVADALFLAVKTVETNLSRVYRKLGVRSRTELARRLADGPSDPAS